MAQPNTFYLRPTDNSLSRRLALITGASGGIGSNCARALAAEGCDLALHYSVNKAADLAALYPEQLFVPCQADLSSPDSTRNLVPNQLQDPRVPAQHKAVSVLVANAGLGRRIRDVADIGESDWDEMFEINTRSQFVVVNACMSGMRVQNWGRVILIGSIARKGGGLNGYHYAASKGALTSMGLNLATLLASEGITVNIVSPAMITSTGMTPTPSPDLETLRAKDPGLAIASTIPVARLGNPDEVSGVVVMFARTGYMTGQEILLTGGLR